MQADTRDAPGPVMKSDGLQQAGTSRTDEDAAALLRSSCTVCNRRELCLPGSLDEEDAAQVSRIVYTRRRVRAGESLYQAGAPFRSLYAVRAGFFKSYIVSAGGRIQVTGFQMSGEIIGVDGIDQERHTLSVAALEDSEVCVIPYSRLEEMSARVPALRRQLHRMMAREIVGDHGVMLLLGSMRAEERVAAFLLNLSRRFVARGYAASQFQLRMTREEIGSYLGLKLETVSRIFSHMHELGVLEVQKKSISIKSVPRLRALVHQAEP